MDVLSFFFFLTVILTLGAICLPLAQFVEHSPDKSELTPEKPSYFILAMSLGLAFFLLFFSLLARLGINYSLVFVLTFITLAALNFFLHKVQKQKGTLSRFFVLSEFTCLAFFFALWLCLLLLRSQFSGVEYDPARLGGEKIFNLALLQSFASGEKFPPEFVWFSTEPIQYYVLPKLFPGLLVHFLKEYCNFPLSARYLFHISDTFFVSLSCGLLFNCAWNLQKCTKFCFDKVFYSSFFGLLPLLHFPIRAIVQCVQGNLNLWSLSRIIDNTVNEYPFWNFLWADNHAHSSAQFLIFLVLFCFLKLLQSKNRGEYLLAFVVGSISTTLAMSHAFSILTVGVFCVTCLSVYLFKDTLFVWRTKAKTLTSAAITALVFYLPEVIFHQSPRVKWYIVPPKLSSAISEFGSIYFYLGLVVFFMLLYQLTTTLKLSKLWMMNSVKIIMPVLFGALPWMLLGYQTVSAIFFLGLLYSKLLTKESEASESTMIFGQPSSILLNATSLGIVFLLIAPELFAFNFDMGQAYMRYNTLFRFIFDSIYICSFCLILFWYSKSSSVSKNQKLLRTTFSFLLLLSAVVQYKTFLLRKNPNQTWTFFPDGFSYFWDRHPYDAKIIEFLSELEEKVVIAEICGDHKEAGAYTVRGRVSAFSGRLSLCGWIGHAGQFIITKQNAPHQGDGGYGVLLDRSKNIETIYKAASYDPKVGSSETELAMRYLQAEGVTHIVVGEAELDKYPNLDWHFFESGLKLWSRIVWSAEKYAVIKLKN